MYSRKEELMFNLEALNTTTLMAPTIIVVAYAFYHIFFSQAARAHRRSMLKVKVIGILLREGWQVTPPHDED